MGKRIIFDVGHPAQVHQFKHLYWELEKKGWTCLFVAKNKDITIDLLKAYKLDFKLLSDTKGTLTSKILQIPKNDLKFIRIIHDFKPDFILHRFSLHSGHVAKIFGVTNIGFSDTEYASKLHKISLPFVDYKFTGKSYYNDLGKNHIKYDGNIELFYLHPKRFSANINPYELLGISASQKYCLVRFVSWEAHHDVGLNVMNLEQKIRLIRLLQKSCKVFISSESKLPGELMEYQIKIDPVYIHSVLKHASLYVGEGATMASEAVCLGTPVIYTNPLPLAGSLREQESYGLLHHAWNMQSVENLLESNSLFDKENHLSYLKTKIDITGYLLWFLDNYPDSVKIIKEDPDYQYQFN